MLAFHAAHGNVASDRPPRKTAAESGFGCCLHLVKRVGGAASQLQLQSGSRCWALLLRVIARVDRSSSTTPLDAGPRQHLRKIVDYRYRPTFQRRRHPAAGRNTASAINGHVCRHPSTFSAQAFPAFMLVGRL
jgi:hypothetical protein